jgi:hypothetical protein
MYLDQSEMAIGRTPMTSTEEKFPGDFFQSTTLPGFLSKKIILFEFKGIYTLTSYL